MSTGKVSRSNATLAASLLTGAFAACQALTAQQALALGSDTVFISANAGVTYDSNLFRLDSGINPIDPNTGLPQDHQDTFIYRYGLGLTADVPYSRQRFQANLTVYDNLYSSFHYLNYVGGSGRAAWLWQVGDDFSGDLGVSLSQSLQNYSYTTVSQVRNVVRYTDLFFDPRYRIAPNFELQVGLHYLTGRNTADVADINDYNNLSARLGLAYVTPSGNHVGLQVESVKSEYPNQSSSNNFDYRDNRVSTFFNWALTGASLIDGSIGYKQRRHDIQTQSDFTGWTGSVGWTWVPTGRTRVRTLLARDIGGVEDLTVTYARTYTLSVNPTYELTSKVNLHGTAQYQDIAFLGNTNSGNINSAVPCLGTLADRNDKVGTLGVGAGYQATRVFSIGLNYTYSHRNSNCVGQDFNDNLVSLTGSLTF